MGYSCLKQNEGRGQGNYEHTSLKSSTSFIYTILNGPKDKNMKHISFRNVFYVHVYFVSAMCFRFIFVILQRLLKLSCYIYDF